MRKVLIFLAIVFTIVLSLNYILGVIQSPKDLVFLGPVHYPPDYYYYVSQFAQGKTRWFTAVDLYTSDFKGATLVGATNVFAGHVMSFFHVPQVVGYAITLTAYTFILFLISIFFLTHLYPKKSHGPLIAFILFAIANMIPGTGSFYGNVAEPLVRFSRVPHQMLGLICILSPMLIVLYCEHKKLSLSTKIILGFLVALVGVTLANINPVQWLLTSCVLFFAIFVHLFFHRPKNIFSSLILNSLFLIPIVFFLSGLPMTLYLSNLFKSLPFSQSAVWESWQQIRLPILSAIQSFGPIAVLAVVGLPTFFAKPTLSRLLLGIYSVASVVLFFSPVSAIGKITNARFLSAITVLGSSAIATDVLLNIPIINIKRRLVVVWGAVLILVVLLVPLGISQFWYHANLDTKNAYIYVSPLVIQTFAEAQKQTTDKDITLVTWPYDESFPALTGRRGFMGHMHLTIDPDRKNQEAFQFFDARIDDAAMHKFLSDNGITYVLGFTSVTKIIKPFMQIVYQNPLLTLYKVLP